MNYLCLIYSDETLWSRMTEAERAAKLEQYSAFNRDAAAAGVLLGGNALAPSQTATSVRVRDAKPLHTDGPFAETKEQLGGYYLLDCADLDEAMAWAARIPAAADGSIEVRPVSDH